jgi:hypothetical protein
MQSATGRFFEAQPDGIKKAALQRAASFAKNLLFRTAA